MQDRNNNIQTRNYKIYKSVQLLTYVGGNAVESVKERNIDGRKLAVHITGLSKLLLDSGGRLLFDVRRSIADVEHSFNSEKCISLTR